MERDRADDDVVLLVDWENVKISTTKALNSLPDILTLKKLALRYGDLKLARAYANWTHPWHEGEADRIALQGWIPSTRPTP